MIDDELADPAGFSLAVRARASYLARQTLYGPDRLRPYAQLTLLLDLELDQASQMLRSLGLRGAYRAVFSATEDPANKNERTLRRRFGRIRSGSNSVTY